MVDERYVYLMYTTIGKFNVSSIPIIINLNKILKILNVKVLKN